MWPFRFYFPFKTWPISAMFFTKTLCMYWNHIFQVDKMKKNCQKKKNASRVFLSILCCSKSCDHPQEDLAKFDYRPDMKVFKNPLRFWLGICWNLLVKKKHSSKTGELGLFFPSSSCSSRGWWAQTVAKYNTWRMVILRGSPSACFLMATQMWRVCRRRVWSCLDWVWWHHVDSTKSMAVIGAQAFHEDVPPMTTPLGAKGVLNYPDILTHVRSIAHHKNRMIQLRPTWTCEYTLQYVHTM